MHVLLPEHTVDKVTDELGVSLADMTCVERLCEDATFNLNKLVRLIIIILLPSHVHLFPVYLSV